MRPIAYLRKKITKKPNKPKQLGYERNSKTGRLEKPGTSAFNTKLELQKQERASLLKEYKRKEKKDPKINAQKTRDRKIQQDRKISDIKGERALNLEIAEKKRKTDLKKRQLKAWVGKVDSLLALSKKGTVLEIKEKTFHEIFGVEIDAIKKSFVSPSLKKSRYNYLHELFTADFFSVFHKSFVPTNMENMSAKDAIYFIESVSKKAKQRKAKIYKEFRENI